MPLTQEQKKQMQDELNKLQSSKSNPMNPVMKERLAFEASQKKQEPEGGIGSKILAGMEKFNDVTGAVIKPAANFLFGTTGKMAGGVITSGIGSAVELAGQATDNKELQAKGVNIQKASGFELPKREGEVGNAPTAIDIAYTALELYPGGGTVSNYLKKIPGAEKFSEVFTKGIPEKLKASAIKAYEQILIPTTKENKFITKKVAPELLDKGVTAFTRKGFVAKTEKLLEKAGEHLDEVLSQIPEGTKIKTQPVIDALEASKKEFIITEGGKDVIVEPEKVKNIDGLISTISELGNDVSFNSLRKLRIIWDKTVAQAKGFMGKTLTEGSLVDAKREATNAIRIELAKDNPILAKANAEYSLWKNVSKVLGDTQERLIGREKPLTQKLANGAGAATGFLSGGMTGAILVGEVADKATMLFSSPAWRSMSAVTKNKIATYLANGDIKKATLLINKLVAGIKNEITK